MTPVKAHCINIYDNQTSLKIGEEIHIVYLLESVLKLAKGERLELYYNGCIGVNHLNGFAPKMKSFVEATEFYSKGDRLSVTPELGYIEECLTRIFKDKLRTEELRQEIDDDIYMLRGVAFYLDEPTSAPTTIDFSNFPAEEPDIEFSPAGPERCFHFPDPETERKEKKSK